MPCRTVASLVIVSRVVSFVFYWYLKNILLLLLNFFRMGLKVLKSSSLHVPPAPTVHVL